MNGDSENFSLPAWAYTDPEFLALERERIFRPSWQVICHLSEIPKPGDYQCFDFIGEMLFAMRGRDGAVRAFHNVCRHRASRLLDGPRGHCARRIVCPYHAWSYDFEGGLASVGDRSAFPGLDIARESLVPVETEIYSGFVFARVQSGGPTVAQMMAAVNCSHPRFTDSNVVRVKSTSGTTKKNVPSASPQIAARMAPRFMA